MPVPGVELCAALGGCFQSLPGLGSHSRSVLRRRVERLRLWGSEMKFYRVKSFGFWATSLEIWFGCQASGVLGFRVPGLGFQAFRVGAAILGG